MENIKKVCDYILLSETENGRTVSPHRMQLLLYFIQVYFLHYTKSPCFTDEAEMWDYGPVIPHVYKRYEMYGSLRIQPSHFEDLAKSTNIHQKKIVERFLEEASAHDTSKLLEICQSQLSGYKSKSETITINDMRTLVTMLFKR